MMRTAFQSPYTETTNSHDVQQNLPRTSASINSSMIKTKCEVNPSIDALRVDPLMKEAFNALRASCSTVGDSKFRAL